MKLRVGWVGKTKNPAIQSLTDEYCKRLRRYVDFEGVSLKDESAVINLAHRDARPRHCLVLMDSRGRQMTSEALAKYVDEYQTTASLPLLFAVGGADGFSADTLQSASLVLSLGKMTMAHELARVVLLEQLYRAFTILKGHPYHTGH